MRRLVFAVAVFVVALAAGGCKRAGSAKLEGHWRGIRAEGATAGAQDTANTFATQTDLIAQGNHITLSTPGGKGQLATYVIDEETKTSLVLHTDKDGPANKETFAFSEDGKTMTWRVGEGRTITFQKVKD